MNSKYQDGELLLVTAYINKGSITKFSKKFDSFEEFRNYIVSLLLNANNLDYLNFNDCYVIPSGPPYDIGDRILLKKFLYENLNIMI